MPIYEFTRKRLGAEEIVSANLSLKELEVYNLLLKAIGKMAVPREDEADNDKECSLYDLVSKEAARAADKNKNGEAEALSWDEYRSAYEKLEKSRVIDEEGGRIMVLPRKYSAHAVIYHGTGFYSTDNRKENAKTGSGNSSKKHTSYRSH
jgi:hypothetical protein